MLMKMATRSELRGFLKQSQRNSEIEEEDVNEIRFRRKRDELVKYMSKLPGYLQGMETSEESVQSNVLNVGVLDWGRLEKWKHGREKGGVRSSKVYTSGVVVPNDSHRCSNLGKGKASRDLQHSAHGVRCTLEPELASRDTFNKQEIASCSYNERVNPGKSRRSRESTSGLLSEMGNSGGSLGAKGDFGLRDKETQKRAGEIHTTPEARENDKASGKQCVEEKIIGDSKENHQCGNIVLLRSRKQSGSTLSGEPQMSLDDNMRVSREVTRSLDFSDGIDSSQIPRSCPLSFDLERYSKDMVLPLGVDLSGKKERSHSKTASRIFDVEMPEDESRKNRYQSPSKRFSFSFGRLSRSFTLKEDSAGQTLSSSDDTIKSDSMRFDSSVCPEKQNVHCGSRVSPLRRLLDPLLRPKGSENVLPSKARSSSSNPKPTNSELPLQDEKKQDTSRRTRALFQLTIRNGIPLFQFVVDDNNNNNNSNSRSILGATMKSSVSSMKDDSVQYCTFYSVNEVKKKKSVSWLIHGHNEEKQRGFVYNVIGQMRLSNSMSLDITEHKSENISPVIRESVLFDESEQVKGRKEVVAVVIKKKPVGEENYTGLEETTVIIPGGVHSFPEKGAPSPLISRWRSGGLCDCGGWDVGCKLHILSNKTFLHKFDQSFKLFDQEVSEHDLGPVLAMKEVKTGIYRVEFSSFVSPLQAFFVCVTVITCGSEEDTVSKTTGKCSSPFAPPLSPVGRV